VIEPVSRRVRAAGAVAALALSACGSGPAGDQIAQAARPAPPDGPTRMSYEVAIAIAAANRNRALEQCAALPAAGRSRCRAEVQSDWDVARAALEDLRGDQG
jgi:hypothetical protein